MRDNYQIIRMFVFIRALYSQHFLEFSAAFSILGLISLYLPSILIIIFFFLNINMGRQSFLFAAPSSCKILLCIHKFPGPPGFQ